MNTCQSCRFWDRKPNMEVSEELIAQGWGTCSKSSEKSGFYGSFDCGYTAMLITGRNFGCNRWKLKMGKGDTR